MNTALKNAKDLTYADLSIGDQFLHDTFKYDPYPNLVDVTEVRTVVNIKTTKTGRIVLTTDKGRWSNGAMAPTTILTD